MKALLKLLMLCFFASLSYAHTLWIETSPNAKMNKKHEIKIFFGELDGPTPTAKWFSDIKDLEIKITTPSGKQMILKEKEQHPNYYSSYFTPTEDGVYLINVNHLVKDLHRGMKITYQSVAYTTTNSKNEKIKLGLPPSELILNTVKPKKNHDISLTVIKNGETKAREKVSVESENGWGKTLFSNDKGEVAFKPIWKGKYLVSHGVSTKEEGKHNGQDYTLDIKSLTYFIEIK